MLFFKRKKIIPLFNIFLYSGPIAASPKCFVWEYRGKFRCRETRTPDTKSSHLQCSFITVTAGCKNGDANVSEGRVQRDTPGPFHHPPRISDVFRRWEQTEKWKICLSKGNWIHGAFQVSDALWGVWLPWVFLALSSLTWWILCLMVDIALEFLSGFFEREFSLFQCWFPPSRCRSQRLWVTPGLSWDGA